MRCALTCKTRSGTCAVVRNIFDSANSFPQKGHRQMNTTTDASIKP